MPDRLTATDLARAMRPNGMPYRRRAPLRAENYITSDETTAVVVIGTHDLTAAAELAAPLWEDDTLPEGTRRWWRLVPWGGEGAGTWIDDPVRGRPVVTYEVEWR